MKLAQMIRNLWTYRKVVLLAVVVGFMTAFIFSNNDKVQLSIPLGPRIENVNAGLLMLISTAVGAGVTWLVMTVRHTMSQARAGQDDAGTDQDSTDVASGSRGSAE